MTGVGLARAQGCVGRVVPQRDGAGVRLAGRQAGVLAADLRAVAGRVRGLVDGSGWSGPGGRAFVAAVTTRVPEVEVVARRYEAVASALLAYASVLDGVQPELARLQRQLTAGVVAAGPVPGGGFGSAGGLGGSVAVGSVDGGEDARLAGLAARFELLWRQWRDGLRVCVRAVDGAAELGRDRHGWSQVVHEVGVVGRALSPVEPLLEHPGLAGLSQALGRLGGELAVIGLVALVVFPPAAGVCLVMAAVVSGAQLGVDAARRVRGERVGSGVLVLDAVGALPGGRLVREGEQAVRGVEAVRGLGSADRAVTGAGSVDRAAVEAAAAPTDQLTRIVPGGGLAVHEAAGGHALARHVAKTVDQLIQRFAKEPKISMSSTFYSREVAENAVSQVLEENKALIQRWLEGGGKSLYLDGVSSTLVGMTVRAGESTASDVSGIFVYLQRRPNMSTGFRVRTAYPQP